MVRRCPECGKGFVVLYPHLWAYKTWSKTDLYYYCSWKCLRANRSRTEKTKEPETANEKERETMAQVKHDRLDMAKQVLAAMDEGTDPIAFLRDVGYAAPAQMYQDLKKTVREVQPDLIEKFPKDLRAWRQQKERAERQPIDDKVAEEIVRDFKQAAIPAEVETPEGEFTVKKPEVPVVPEKPGKITRPINYDGYDVAAIRSEQLGEFYFDKKFNSIDWRTAGGDEVSMPPVWWIQLVSELPKILRILGVDA